MARTPLAAQRPTVGGLTPTFTAANADGHSFRNSGRTELHVKTGANPTNLTFQTPRTVDGNAVADKVVAIPANAERIFGQIDEDAYNRNDDLVYVDFSAVTNVTVALIEP